MFCPRGCDGPDDWGFEALEHVGADVSIVTEEKGKGNVDGKEKVLKATRCCEEKDMEDLP